jgi:hypothetical protein
MLTQTFVTFMSTVVVVREIAGPLGSVVVVDAIFVVQQCLFDIILACIVSLQEKTLSKTFLS